MYGHINNHSLVNYTTTSSPELYSHFPSLDTTAPPPLVIPAGNELGYSCSSGCSSYGSPGSLTSYSDPSPSLMMMQRSESSHSLLIPKNNNSINNNNNNNNISNGFRHQLVSSSKTSPVRKVFSTGDLQRINMVQRYHRSESPLSNENNSIIEGMISKACPYGPEEKKERIERYRIKRSQRNFNKKIKYECRKTLADSRPRIRGRFARNDEIFEKSSESQWSQVSVEEDDEDDDQNWINLLDSFSANLIP